MPQIIFKKKLTKEDGDSPQKNQEDHTNKNDDNVSQKEPKSRLSQLDLSSTKKEQRNQQQRSKTSIANITSMQQQQRARTSSQHHNNRFRDFKLYKDQTVGGDRVNTTLCEDGYKYIDYSASKFFDLDPQQSVDNGFMNQSIMGMPGQNIRINSRQKLIDQKLNNLVLYDAHRMFRGEQNLRMQDLLKQGKKGILLTNIKHPEIKIETKVPQSKSKSVNRVPNYDLVQHMQKFQSQIKPFYKQEKIVTTQELDQVIGKGKGYYLLDTGEVGEFSMNRGSVENSMFNQTLQSFHNPRPQTNHTTIGGRRKINPGLNPYDSSNQLGLAEIMAHSDEMQLKSPNNNEIIMLKRKFEDNESNIIHDLYAKHFQHKQKTNQPPQPAQINDDISQHFVQDDTNSQESKSIDQGSFQKVKYVQYVPKQLRGSNNESVINEKYFSANDTQGKQTLDMVTVQHPPALSNFSTLEMREKRCHSQHQHARRCNKMKELDVVELENQAFHSLKVANEPVFTKKEGLCHASFFPSSQLPDELKYILHENQEFQKSMLINEHLLLKRPQSKPHTQSRFNSKNGHYTTFNTTKHQQFVMNGDISDIATVHSNLLAQDRGLDRNKIALQTKSESMPRPRNQDETYDSNKLDPEFMNQQAVANMNQQRLHNESQLQRSQGQLSGNFVMGKNYYFPKVSILNYFSGISQNDSQSNNVSGEQQMVNSWDFSMHPISDKNLRINIEKETRLQSQAAKVASSQAQSDEVIGEGMRGSIITSNQDETGIAANIFKPRQLLNSLGSSNRITPKQSKDNKELENEIDSKKGKFFNFQEVNKLQQNKWKSPFVHMKNCDYAKKVNLKKNELVNYEKSYKVQYSQSLNTSMNNPYALWTRTKETKFRKRKQKGQSNDGGDRNLSANGRRVIPLSNTNAQVVNDTENIQVQGSLIAMKVKQYQRPRTQQIGREGRRVNQKGLKTIAQQYEEIQRNSVGANTGMMDQSFVNEQGRNNDMRFDTDSLSISSGNMNQNPNQSSLSNLHKSDGNKRLIISKRSGDIFGKRYSRQGNEEYGQSTLAHPSVALDDQTI